MVRVALRTTLVIVVLIFLVVARDSWWPQFYDFVETYGSFFEQLGFILAILVPLMGAGGVIWYWMRDSGGQDGEEVDEGSGLPGEPRLPEGQFGKVLETYLRWLVARHDRTRLHG